MNVIGVDGWGKSPGAVVRRGVVLNLMRYSRPMRGKLVNLRRSVPHPKVMISHHVLNLELSHYAWINITIVIKQVLTYFIPINVIC